MAAFKRNGWQPSTGIGGNLGPEYSFHVSFDVDGCDPSVIPGSGTLVQGGVRYREAHLLLEYCADSRQLTSMEVVELNPFVDHRNISAERILELITSALGKSIL